MKDTISGYLAVNIFARIVRIAFVPTFIFMMGYGVVQMYNPDSALNASPCLIEIGEVAHGK